MNFTFNWTHYPISETKNMPIKKYILSLPYMFVSLENNDGIWEIFFNQIKIIGTPIFIELEVAKNWIETDIACKMNAFIEFNKEQA